MNYAAPGDMLIRLHTAAEALQGAAAHGTFAPGDVKAVAELAAADSWWRLTWRGWPSRLMERAGRIPRKGAGSGAVYWHNGRAQ